MYTQTPIYVKTLIRREYKLLVGTNFHAYTLIVAQFSLLEDGRYSGRDLQLLKTDNPNINSHQTWGIAVKIDHDVP